MWAEPETVIQSEASQKEKNKYHITSLICYIQKNGKDELICTAEGESRMQGTNTWLSSEEGKGEMNWEVETDIYTPPCLKPVINQNLLYRTENSTQCSVVT